MNGYATQNAEGHATLARCYAKAADDLRSNVDDRLLQDCINQGVYDSRMMAVRVCQNLAVMHYEDAQRIRNTR